MKSMLKKCWDESWQEDKYDDKAMRLIVDMMVEYIDDSI